MEKEGAGVFDLDKTKVTMEPEKSTGGGLYVPGKDRVVYVPPERKSRLGLDALAIPKWGESQHNGGFKVPKERAISIAASAEDEDKSESTIVDDIGDGRLGSICRDANRRYRETTSETFHAGQMAPRWKGKDAKAKRDAEVAALREPMSKIISQLQSSLGESNTCALLSDNSVHLAVGSKQIDLIEKACFGRPTRAVENDIQWFQLSMEEAFYLCHSLKCLKIDGGDTGPLNDEELCHYMKFKKESFPYLYKAYSRLRMKNWVVRQGAQYGVDYIVYRHHPAQVHSEYRVLVLSGEDDKDRNGRLRVWSDDHCTTRLLGSVAKILFVMYVNKNGNGDDSPLCLENYTIEEHTITRWSPQQCRESCSSG